MTGTVPEHGELLHVDPATLTIGANVRTETHADAKQFARSIRERGVLEVITAYRDQAGQLVVLRGQRRTIVATQVGTPTGTVPVRVVAAPVEGDRIVDQLAENLHRHGIGQPDVVAGLEQLSLVGLSPAQIAKRTALRRPEVDAALTVARCQPVRDQVASGALTLEQAAIFVEFSGDEDATDRLRAALRRGTPLAHAAQQLRDEAAERADQLAEVARLRGEGLPVLDPDDAPGSLWRIRLEDLRDADGDPVPVESWPNVEGAAVVLTTEWVYPDATTDEEDAEPVEAGDAEPERRFVPVWIVPDPGAAGLHHRYDSGQQSATGPVQPSEADREAASAERRRVIAHNKAWRSAQTVRRDWLTQFIARKTVPSGAEALICEAILTSDHRLSTAMDKRHPLLRSLLGESDDRHHDSNTACERLATDPKTPKAQTVRSLAAVLAAWEDSSGTHTWRNPSPWDARIMTALIGWGYPASPVERILIGEEPATSGQDAR